MYKQIQNGIDGASISIREPSDRRRTVRYVPVPRSKKEPVKRRVIRVVLAKSVKRELEDPARLALGKSKAAKARQPQPQTTRTERVDPAAVALQKIKAAKAKLAGGA